MESRVCKTCGELKSLEAFTKHKLAKGGHLSHCKPCLALKSKAYKAQDPEKWKAINRESKRSSLTAKDADKKRKKVAYSKDPKKFLERNKAYYQANREKVASQALAYRKENKDRFSLLAAERNSRRRTATPSWVNGEAILSFYRESRMLTKLTGVKHEVDHIVPLQSVLVCGLHVPWNLRVVTKRENAKKSNRYWPDMWDDPDTTILSEVA